MSASSGAVRGYDSKVEIIVGTDQPVTTEIVGIPKFDLPDQSPELVDVTHLRSPGDTEETIRGMKKTSTWPLEHHYVPGSEMDMALKGIWTSGIDVILSITAVGADARQYVAYLNDYRASDVTPKGVMMATSTFIVKAEITAEVAEG